MRDAFDQLCIVVGRRIMALMLMAFGLGGCVAGALIWWLM